MLFLYSSCSYALRVIIKKSSVNLYKSYCLSKMPFYAVAKGRTPGIFMSWADCEAQVKAFSGARFKKFDTVTQAQDFINAEGGNSSSKAQPSNSKPTNMHNNLKRTSTSVQAQASHQQKAPVKTSKSGVKKYNETVKINENNSDSEDSDDLNAMLVKQMDDIEKRVKDFAKGVDKIVKKGASSKSSKKAIMIEPPQKKKKSSKSEFEISSDGFVQVYTDGACSANGQRGARAGLGVYWSDDHPLNTSQPVSGRATNNCGEIQAATHAIKQALDNGITQLAINTDSQFLINSITKWIPGWKRKGWKLKSGEPVKNETDFKELDKLQNQLTVRWNYVEAHRGVYGNEMADQLAKAGAAMYKARN